MAKPFANYTLGSAFTTTTTAVAIENGTYQWSIYGTWNGASGRLQWSPNNSTWIDVDGASRSADGGVTGIPLASGWARVAMTGTATSLASKLGGI